MSKSAKENGAHVARPVTTLERRFQKVWETLNDLCIRVFSLEKELEQNRAKNAELSVQQQLHRAEAKLFEWADQRIDGVYLGLKNLEAAILRLKANEGRPNRPKAKLK